MSKEQFNGGEVNHFFGGFGRNLIVSCQSPEAVEPCKGPFDHPSQRLWSETSDSVWGIADFKFYFKILFDMLNDFPTVPSVRKDSFERSPSVCRYLTKPQSQLGIMFGGILYRPAKNESVAVNNNIAFDTLYLFIGIKTIVAVTITLFYALSIQCAYGRQLILFPLPSDSHDKFFDAMFYTAIISPFAEMPIDSLPLREVFWEHSPLTSADKQVKDCLKDRAQRIFTVSAIIFKEYFVYIRPLALGQMCLIEFFYAYEHFFSYQHSV